MMRFIRRFVIGATFCLCAWVALAAPRAEHVFVISIDGGNPRILQRGAMPVLKKLMRGGAHTSVATTSIPPLTLPAHASMLTGVAQDLHKVTWNDLSPTNGVVSVPTVFSVARQAGLSTAMFVGKEKFRHLVQPGAVDEFRFNREAAVVIAKDDSGNTDKKKEGNVFAEVVARDAADYILRARPNLCFIHFADADSYGHEYGWGSPEQFKALADTDAGLGAILKAIREAGLAKKSVIIISADHGGHGRGHSKGTAEDMHIPWIAWGKGVKSRFTITEPVYTCDTAATALWLLGLEPTAKLDGAPVMSAFK
jgi:predicted AlkP superfamily pyrophosphatase or phosphodiesterase